jgi:hypothetical protein
MAYFTYSPGSTEYQALMQSILNKEFGRSPQRRSTRCLRAEPPPPPSPFDENFLSFLVALFSLPKELWNKHAQQPVAQKPPVPVSPNAQLFRTQMEALPPFTNMSREHHDGILVEWVNSFVDIQNLDMVIMNRPNADVPHLRNTVLRSPYGFTSHRPAFYSRSSGHGHGSRVGSQG